ncbi:DUF6783 domain-containing protein [Anaerobutyricum hallii]
MQIAGMIFQTRSRLADERRS